MGKEIRLFRSSSLLHWNSSPFFNLLVFPTTLCTEQLEAPHILSIFSVVNKATVYLDRPSYFLGWILFLIQTWRFSAILCVKICFCFGFHWKCHFLGLEVLSSFSKTARKILIKAMIIKSLSGYIFLLDTLEIWRIPMLHFFELIRTFVEVVQKYILSH